MTVRLDEWIQNESVENIDLTKIDAATIEPEALEGLVVYLEKWKPGPLSEVLEPEIGKRIEEQVAPHGYRYVYVDEKKGVIPSEHISGR